MIAVTITKILRDDNDNDNDDDDNDDGLNFPTLFYLGYLPVHISLVFCPYFAWFFELIDFDEDS